MFAEPIAATNFSFLTGASHPGEMVEQAIALGEQTGERSHSAELWRLHAQAAWSNGSSDARSRCEHDLRVAIDIARVQGSIMFERRALSDLNRLQAAVGENDIRRADGQLL